MLKFKFAVIFAIILFSAQYAHTSETLEITSSDQSELTYSIEPKIERGRCILEIEMQFRGDKSGKTDVTIPHRWAGNKDLYKGVYDIDILTPEVSYEHTDNPYTYTLKHKSDEVIALKYKVRQMWSGELTEQTRYRPIMNRQYFQSVGYGIFAFPKVRSNGETNIRLKWNLPKGWRVANSFGANQRFQNFNTTIPDFLNGIYMGGDYRVQEVDVSGKPLYIAVRGNWRFLVQNFYDLAKKIASSQRSFWNDYQYPYYLVAITPMSSKRRELLGGSGHTNSFSMFVASSSSDLNRIRHLLSHEMFHNWIGRIIVSKKPEELLFWFSEGFTDYYASLLNLRAGLITLPEYIEGFNNVLSDYFSSPYKDKPNKWLLNNFWKDGGQHRLPYMRGNILAHNWNYDIKSSSKHSLDDMMFDLLREAKAKGSVASNESVNRLISPYKKGGVMGEIRNYIEQGKTLKPKDGALGPCVKLEMKATGKNTSKLPQYVLDKQAYGSNPERCMKWFR